MDAHKAEFMREMERVYDEGAMIDQVLDAIGRHDHAEAKRLMPQVPLDPGTLKAYKKLYGADFIREWNMNTTLADQEFGEGWLDRAD